MLKGTEHILCRMEVPLHPVIAPEVVTPRTVTPKGLVQPGEVVRRAGESVVSGKSGSGLSKFLGKQTAPKGLWHWWQREALPQRTQADPCSWECCPSSSLTWTSLCLTLLLWPDKPCSCDLSLGACYSASSSHRAGSVQVDKQKTSFHYCCCFYCAIAMSFIKALLFLWGIISGNLDRILWLTLEKVIKSWEPKVFLCFFH